jgi:flagellar biosynthesis chaperone FliJ
MAKRNVLDRLWRLRELEEEQSRLELESRVGKRNRIAQNRTEAAADVARSRGEFHARLGDPDAAARTGALVEWEEARLRQDAIRSQLENAEAAVEVQRDDFFARRIARRQVESLLEGEREAGRVETARRAQQILDDWFGRRGTAGRPPELVHPVKALQFQGIRTAPKLP